MRRVMRFWKVIIFDALAVVLMILAALTSPLPGPGGIPLLILSLTLLAVHHAWAKRYIDLLKKHADKLGDYIFVKNPKIQLAYDILAPPLVLLGAFWLQRHSALWMISLGLFAVFTGITFLLGNRDRYKRIKQSMKGS
ncbi:MAG: hypothetical protein V4702_02295 [Patescibacteria group bacterium]